jgi:hypothetical protein
MSSTAIRGISIAYSGDFAGNESYTAATNTNSPAMSELKTLTTGANTITPPTGGSTVKGVTIIPPASNAVLMTLKGVTGDTGVPMHKTDPTSIGLDTTVSTFCVTCAAPVIGVRFLWT